MYFLSSLLHPTRKGRVVTFRMSYSFKWMESPLTIVVELFPPWELRTMENYWVISLSYSFNWSKNPIHWYLRKMSITGGSWWIIFVSVGSLLLKPPPISPTAPSLGYLRFIFNVILGVVSGVEIMNSFIFYIGGEGWYFFTRKCFFSVPTFPSWYDNFSKEITTQWLLQGTRFKHNYSCICMEIRETGGHLPFPRWLSHVHEGLKKIVGGFGSLSPLN